MGPQGSASAVVPPPDATLLADNIALSRRPRDQQPLAAATRQATSTVPADVPVDQALLDLALARLNASATAAPAPTPLPAV